MYKRQYQDDPMFHQLSLKFDLPGYSGLMCTFLNKSDLGDYQLFKKKKKDQEKKGDFHISDKILNNHLEDSNKILQIIKQKQLCPMLETYREHFSNQSLIFQGTQSILPGEKFINPMGKMSKEMKTNDKLLDNLDPVSYTHLTLPTTPYV